MLILPRTLVIVIGAFAPLFSKRAFEYAQLLVVGAILAPGKCTITAVLRLMGNADHSYVPSRMGERSSGELQSPLAEGGEVICGGVPWEKEGNVQPLSGVFRDNGSGAAVVG